MGLTLGASDAPSSTVIDSAQGKLITNISLGGKPEHGASAGDGKVYAIWEKAAIVILVCSPNSGRTRLHLQALNDFV